jgi:predicted nucleotide-binding protein
MEWDVKMPSLGEALSVVQVMEVLVNPGQVLKEDEIFMVLEAQKADVEIPSPFNCTVVTVELKRLDTVRIGDVLMKVEVAPDAQPGKKESISNILTGLRWITNKSVDGLLAGIEDLDEFRQFVENTIFIAEHLRTLPLYKLQDYTIDPLRLSLYDVTRMFSRFERLATLTTNAKKAEYEKVIRSARQEQRDLLRHFYYALKYASEWLNVQMPEMSQKKLEPLLDKVFIVHGRDLNMATLVKRELQDFGLVPIILDELASRGRTIVEKLEQTKEVSFAVVLLTPDDIGGLTGSSYDHLQPRARQNVIFELGFFIGVLGREKVVALYDKTVEVPSDYQGVVFIELDRYEKWKERLKEELKEARLLIK